MRHVCLKRTRVIVALFLGLSSYGCGLQIHHLESISQKNKPLPESLPQIHLSQLISNRGGYFNTLYQNNGSSSAIDNDHSAILASYFRIGGDLLRFGGMRIERSVVNGALSMSSSGYNQLTDRLKIGNSNIIESTSFPSEHHYPKFSITAQTPDSTVYILGAVDSGLNSAVTNAYKFDLENFSWTPIAPVPEAPRRGIAVATSANKITLVILTETHIAKFYEYDTAANLWSLKATQPGLFGNYTHYSADLLPNKKVLYKAGKTSGSSALSLFQYDPESGSISLLPELSNSQASMFFESRVAIRPDGGVLLVGAQGTDGNLLTSTLAWTPGSGSWLPGPELPYPTKVTHVHPMTNGKSLIFDKWGNSIEYNPQSNTFNHWTKTNVASIPSATSYIHQIYEGNIINLPDGTVITFGNSVGGGDTINTYSNGNWSAQPKESRMQFEYYQVRGISSDRKIIAYSDFYNWRIYLKNTETQELKVIPFLKPEEFFAQSVQFSEDKILFVVTHAANTRGSNITEGNSRTAILDLSTQTLTPGPNRTTNSKPLSGSNFLGEYTFANRYVLLHSGATHTPSSPANVHSPFEIYDGESNTWENIGHPPKAQTLGAVAYHPGEQSLYFFTGNNTNFIDRYDLTTKAWSSITLTHRARSKGTATWLSDRKFLLLGSTNEQSSEYEIIDLNTPSSTIFTSPNLKTIGINSIDFFKSSSDVFGLKIGDGKYAFPYCFYISQSICNNIQIYDSSTNTWSLASKDGLAVGFSPNYLRFGNTIAMAYPKTGSSIGVDVYDSNSNQWLPLKGKDPTTPALSANQIQPIHMTSLGNEKMLWVGEITPESTLTPKCYIFDVLTGKVMPIASIPVANANVLSANYNITANFFDAVVFGKNGSAAVYVPNTASGIPEFYFYNSTTNSWSNAIPSPHGAVLYPALTQTADGRIAILGGINNATSAPSNELHWVDIENQSFSRGPDLPPTLSNLVLGKLSASESGRLLLSGGVDLDDMSPLLQTYYLDPESSSWTPGPTLPRAYIYHSSFSTADNSIILLGGLDETFSESNPHVARINVDTLEVESLPDLPLGYNSLLTSRFVVGNLEDGINIFHASGNIYKLDLQNNTWTKKNGGSSITAAAPFNRDSALIWRSKGSNANGFLSSIELFSTFEAVPFLMSGGSAPYTFNEMLYGALFTLENTNLFLPFASGSHIISGHDSKGRSFTSKTITAH
jgi:N-acetylneuraminic acid mutarotase